MTEAPVQRRRKRKPWVARPDDPRSIEIRSIALELVAQKGYDAVSIDEIVAVAGASKSTVYRRWSSKAELIVDAVRHNTRQSDEPGDTGSLRDDLIAMLSVVADELSRDGDLVVALVAAARRNEELMAVIRTQLREPGLTSGRIPLERAIARGELPGDTDTLLVDEVAMPMLMHRLLLNEPLDPEFVAFVVDRILLGLAKPA